ncbi:MAG: acetyl-CoA carboxylase carboxyltransferase subunit beta [Alphaproteobacteria bacterium]|nr:acetyl-CoA carboxylase carboxyltransferase subunit beta [Alphaproteobacteria bacterium]
MNWITNFVRPKIKGFFNARETPENLWRKCANCGEMIFHRDLLAAQNVCPSCDHHMRIGPKERFAALFDDTYEELHAPEAPADPLKFRDERRYTERLKDARTKTGAVDAMQAAKGRIDGEDAVVVVQNFAFMGGSLGMGAGEAFVSAARLAVAQHLPLVMITASGGARMQEGILSLMQMPRTTVAVEELREAGLPYIVVLTDPTSGGVTASYAMLGDIQLAEPGAMIAFSGPRVIENTIREKLPEGFQRAEYLLAHGMIDAVVHRHKLKETLGRMIRLLMKPLPIDPAKTNGSGGIVPVKDAALMPVPPEEE